MFEYRDFGGIGNIGVNSYSSVYGANKKISILQVFI